MAGPVDFRLRSLEAGNDVRLYPLSSPSATPLTITLRSLEVGNDVRLFLFGSDTGSPSAAVGVGIAQAEALGTPVAGVGTVAAIGVGIELMGNPTNQANRVWTDTFVALEGRRARRERG